MRKTIGELIDCLSIVNIKIHFLVEKINSGKSARSYAKKLQALNKLRNDYIQAINKSFKSKGKN